MTHHMKVLDRTCLLITHRPSIHAAAGSHEAASGALGLPIRRARSARLWGSTLKVQRPWGAAQSDLAPLTGSKAPSGPRLMSIFLWQWQVILH